MAVVVVTLHAQAPPLETKIQEAQRIARYLGFAMNAVNEAGDKVAGGNIRDNGGAVVGTWIYEAAN